MQNIGPQLPPHLADRLAQEHVDDDEPASSEQMPSRSVGPQLPPHLIKEDAASRSIGPQLPPHLTGGDNADKHDKEEEDKEAEEDDGGSYGPALPPSFESARATERRNIGPQLPPHIRTRTRAAECVRLA